MYAGNTVTVNRLSKLYKLLVLILFHPTVQFLFESVQTVYRYYFLR